MKRIKRSVTQRAWKYEEMFPTFVSIVPTGANRIPFAALKLSEDSEYAEGYEIQKIIFGSSFTKDSATAYLEDKGIVDYVLKNLDDGRLYVESSEEFEEVKSITLENIEVFVGKTDFAAKQVKTQIVSGNPVMKLEDKADTSDVAEKVVLEDTLATEPEVTDAVDAETPLDPADTEAKLEEPAAVADSADSTIEDTAASEVVDTADAEPTTEESVDLELGDNEYINSLKAANAYYVVDKFIYKLRYALEEILESKLDVESRVKAEVMLFADATVAHFTAIESIPEVDTTAVQMSDTESADDGASDAPMADTQRVLIETLNKKLSEFEEKLASALEKSTTDIDNTTVMLQTSKADVTAFDQSPSHEVEPQVKQLTSNTKNLFGY